MKISTLLLCALCACKSAPEPGSELHPAVSTKSCSLDKFNLDTTKLDPDYEAFVLDVHLYGENGREMASTMVVVDVAEFEGEAIVTTLGGIDMHVGWPELFPVDSVRNYSIRTIFIHGDWTQPATQLERLPLLPPTRDSEPAHLVKEKQ